jgi:hypothetical protein
MAALLAALCLSACDLAQEESAVGSGADTQINNVVFTVDTTYLEASPMRLVARGRAGNTGTATITAPWYVEGQFYADSTFRTKLGGNYTTINVPLSRNQETFWTITFSSGNVDVRLYPYFRVRDLRAIYK